MLPKDEIDERAAQRHVDDARRSAQAVLDARDCCRCSPTCAAKRRCRCWPRRTTPALSSTASDLTGWTGDTKLWSVENGEIVGRSPGLDAQHVPGERPGGRGLPLVVRSEARRTTRQQRHAVPLRAARRLRRSARLPGRHRRRLVGQALRRERPGTVCGTSRASSTSRRASGTTTRSRPSAATSARGSTASCASTSTTRDGKPPRHLRAAAPLRRADGSAVPESAAGSEVTNRVNLDVRYVAATATHAGWCPRYSVQSLRVAAGSTPALAASLRLRPRCAPPRLCARPARCR